MKKILKILFKDLIFVRKSELEKEIKNIEETVEETNKSRNTNYKIESYSVYPKYLYIKSILDKWN